MYYNKHLILCFRGQFRHTLTYRKIEHMSFAKLKRNRKKSLEILVDQAQKATGGNRNRDDENFWKPTRDKSGNGYAVIRFLPSPEEGTFWTQYWDHGFQGPTGLWYIERSRSSLGPDERDPVAEHNGRLWNSGVESDKEIARKQKRRLHYVANVLVIADPANPDNEGKVFLYQFGKKIFDKLVEAMQPEFEDETAVNPFDMWEGADFKIKIRKVEGWVNYDKSEFDSPSPLLDGDEEKLEEIYNKTHSLAQFTDAKNYKSYDDLLARYNRVLGENSNVTRTAEEVDLDKSDKPKAQKAATEPEIRSSQSSSNDDKDDDEDLSYFQNLIKDD